MTIMTISELRKKFKKNRLYNFLEILFIVKNAKVNSSLINEVTENLILSGFLKVRYNDFKVFYIVNKNYGRS